MEFVFFGNENKRIQTYKFLINRYDDIKTHAEKQNVGRAKKEISALLAIAQGKNLITYSQKISKISVL